MTMKRLFALFDTIIKDRPGEILRTLAKTAETALPDTGVS